MVGTFLEPSRGRRLKPIHSIPYSVAQPLERGSNNYYSIIQGYVIIYAFFKGGCKIPHTDLNSNRFADDSGSDWHCKYRINYDMLNYLPEDMDTIIGQNELMEDFGKGAFSFIIVEDMPNKDVAALKAKIEQVDHVDTVIWYDTLFDLSVPMELLPDKIYTEFNTDHSTMMAVFFDSSTSADITMDAIREIRALCGKQCYG